VLFILLIITSLFHPEVFITDVAVYSQKLQLRAEVADVFLAKFQLRPEEVQILRGTRDGILHPVRHCPYSLFFGSF